MKQSWKDAGFLKQLQRSTKVAEIAEIDLGRLQGREWREVRVRCRALDQGILVVEIGEVLLRLWGEQVLDELLGGVLLLRCFEDGGAGDGRPQ